jgi:pilus assembly protein CpaF
MHLQVVVQSDDGMQRTELYPANGPLTIGRHPQCSLRLDSDLVSRQHAVIQAGNGTLRVEDVSTNGTIAGDLLLRRDSVEVPYGTPIVVGDFTVFVYPAEQQNAAEHAAMQSRPMPPLGTNPIDTRQRMQGSGSHVPPAGTGPNQPGQSHAPVIAQAGQKAEGERPKEVFEETLLQLLAPIRPFLDDPLVSDIMINGPDQIYVEREGQLRLTNARFETREALLAALRNAAQYIGKHVDELTPILEGRLPDGSRIEAILPPAAPDGPCVSIRRSFKETLTVERLIGLGALTRDVATALQALVVAKLNVLIAGGTGCGKTSMLNALSSFIPEGERVVVIEESRELQLQRPHICTLEARPPDPRGRGEVTIRELFRATLRMRPDRIVVGEIGGEEALDVIQAMTSGHGGFMSTLRATYPRDTISRLETMAMMSDVEMPLAALRVQLASAVDIICQVSRLQDGSRKITHVTEVIGFDGTKGEYVMQDIFVRQYHGFDERGAIVSDLVPSGILPRCLPQLHERGVDLPASVYEAAKNGGSPNPYGQG